MNYELNENNFFVTEQLKPVLTKTGKYYYYWIEKKGLSHKQLTRILPRGFFCGVKDKNAVTRQWFCTKHYFEPSEIKNEKIIAKYKGLSDERLFVGKHVSNKFKIRINLNEKEFNKIKKIDWKKSFISNYFGEQRFDERTSELKKLLEKQDYENALKQFLVNPSKFDSEQSSEIKKIITKNWKNWKKIVDSNIPENKKIVFRELEKGTSFENAFEFVEQKSLKQLLKAIQSQRFNEELNKESSKKISEQVFTIINKTKISLKANKSFKKKIVIEANEFEQKFGLKKFDRKTFFQPKKFKTKKNDKEYWIEFELEKGCYATIMLEYLKQILNTN